MGGLWISSNNPFSTTVVPFLRMIDTRWASLWFHLSPKTFQKHWGGRKIKIKQAPSSQAVEAARETVIAWSNILLIPPIRFPRQEGTIKDVEVVFGNTLSWTVNSQSRELLHLLLQLAIWERVTPFQTGSTLGTTQQILLLLLQNLLLLNYRACLKH